MASKFAPALWAFVFSLGISAARADVAITSYQRSGGFKGFGAFDGNSEDKIQGLKSRSVQSVKYQNALMRMAGRGDRNEIIRVDLDKVWELNPKKKTYTERPITPPPLKEGKPVGDKPGPAAPGKPEKEEKPTHRLKKAEFTVKKTGDKKNINGFATERYLANAIIEVEEIASQEVTSFLLDTNIWTTPWTKTLRQAMDEQLKFSKAYFQKMGLPLSAEKHKAFDASSVRMLLGVSGAKTEETLDNLGKKIASIEGFPVATETVWTVREDPNAVARREKEKASTQKAQADDNKVDVSGGAADIAGGLLGGFAKKKMKERQEKVDAKRAGEPVLSTYYEVKSVGVAPLDAGAFDVPAGYKKIGK